MNLQELKNTLAKVSTILFQLPDGSLVPPHFHVTEIGLVNKTFIDCGGTLRDEQKISMQLYNASDYDHRLHPEKLSHIVDLSEKVLNLPNAEIEVEYQGETIGKYALAFNGTHFLLGTTVTDCLAKDKCGIPVPAEKKTIKLAGLSKESCCTPGTGCC